MRAKDIAFVAEVLANEARHAMPEEVAGLLAAVGALRVAITQRQPDADVTELLAIEGAQLPAMPSGARPGDYVTVTVRASYRQWLP